MSLLKDPARLYEHANDAVRDAIALERCGNVRLASMRRQDARGLRALARAAAEARSHVS